MKGWMNMILVREKKKREDDIQKRKNPPRNLYPVFISNRASKTNIFYNFNNYYSFHQIYSFE